MAKAGETRPKHSLWDRLLSPATQAATAGAEFDAARAGVCRDLEKLLNTRRYAGDDELDLPHLDRSLLAFGIPEISAVNPNSSNDRLRLARIIRQAIDRFEPRLRDPEVEYVPRDEDSSMPRLHFRIRASLWIAGTSGPIAFDTDLDLGSRIFSLKT